ncbi:iron/ascorbate oxidoreductase family protein [Strigomonas culicis]|uniref:Iron/ascorbate oxidoreductase family protein n=1 Tax=Strigomonas culicis TaxID=28005 RepID=S9V842_9TRYP|nr:iron/ascorbate oxidoreductase family protein [Strigomonas culicis]|eukprot:EPY19100.1 iron/ascorbate oxidoreductase family protein [Strigomonas culicis]
MSTEVLNLPIIDLSELDNENTRADFYRKLRHMARDVGFFYLVGHGVDPAERDDLLDTAKRFFALPQDAKDKISMDNSPHFRGYTKLGNENTRNKTDYREQLDIGEEVPAELRSEDDPEFYLNLHGPNPWPAEVPELKEKALAYQGKMHSVAVKLLRAFVVALGLPEDSLDEMIGGTPRQLLKLVHYPANTGEDGEGQQQGCGPHKDSDFLTLLWQDGTGGLQVLTDDKGWVDAAPLKDSYIVNIGELLELTTNGYLIANVHQVVMRRTTRTSRYSIPYFLGPNLEVKEVPLLPLPAELQAQARGPTSDPLNPLFNDVGINAIKGRLRSHKNTTMRFYPKTLRADSEEWYHFGRVSARRLCENGLKEGKNNVSK